jgi:hypothetical protein
MSDEIVLWMEHDLHDQLQRLQILERLPVDGPPRVTAVPDGDYLGGLPATRFAELFEQRREVSSAERMAARDAWDAFRSPDPRALVDVLPRVAALSHMTAAIRRHLEQFPSIDRGLSRSERQAMDAIQGGVTRAADVYRASHHGREEAVFMGDALFLVHVGALVRGPVPLVRSSGGSPGLAPDDTLELTVDGAAVLEGRADRVARCGIDRWLGGVELAGTGPVWRWDAARATVRLA